jgi:pimeloyl-ACP methyl ester carboxylesterase
MLEETAAEIAAARLGEAALRAHLDALGEGPEALDAWVERLPPSDREILARPDVRTEEALEAEEWGAQGIDGWIDDDLALFGFDWGFDPAAIAAPTRLAYGDADVLVPPSHGRAWARAVPHAELEFIPGAGHWLRDHELGLLRWCAERVRSGVPAR